jgi:hypothetical protein
MPAELCDIQQPAAIVGEQPGEQHLVATVAA